VLRAALLKGVEVVAVNDPFIDLDYMVCRQSWYFSQKCTQLLYFNYHAMAMNMWNMHTLPVAISTNLMQSTTG